MRNTGSPSWLVRFQLIRISLQCSFVNLSKSGFCACSPHISWIWVLNSISAASTLPGFFPKRTALIGDLLYCRIVLSSNSIQCTPNNWKIFRIRPTISFLAHFKKLIVRTTYHFLTFFSLIYWFAVYAGNHDFAESSYFFNLKVHSFFSRNINEYLFFDQPHSPFCSRYILKISTNAHFCFPLCLLSFE